MARTSEGKGATSVRVTFNAADRRLCQQVWESLSKTPLALGWH